VDGFQALIMGWTKKDKFHQNLLDAAIKTALDLLAMT
jgi:hypothetical protein